jgi:hypothetical protein
MHVELRDLITLTDEPEKLALSRGQCTVWHHVQQTDVQFTDILVQCSVGIQNRLTPFAQTLKGWKWRVSYKRHGVSNSAT